MRRAAPSLGSGLLLLTLVLLGCSCLSCSSVAETQRDRWSAAAGSHSHANRKREVYAENHNKILLKTRTVDTTRAPNHLLHQEQGSVPGRSLLDQPEELQQWLVHVGMPVPTSLWWVEVSHLFSLLLHCVSPAAKRGG